MRLTITIDMDNAAFVDANANGFEVARILNRLASEVREENLSDGFLQTLWDSNGNRVGNAVASKS